MNVQRKLSVETACKYEDGNLIFYFLPTNEMLLIDLFLVFCNPDCEADGTDVN